MVNPLYPFNYFPLVSGSGGQDSLDSSDSCSKKTHPHGKIRVHPCAKNIRDIREIRVQRKNSIRVPKTFDIREIRVQKSSPPKFHTPMQNPGGPLLSYSNLSHFLRL